MARKKVSVSIVNYNGKRFLGDCLTSLRQQDYPDIEVVLVDNASTDGSASFVAENFPEVRVIVNDENCFFCRGQNIGIRNTSGEYVLALNNDVVLGRSFVSGMVTAIETDPGIGSVSGRILRTGGDVVDTTGLFMGRDRRPLDRGYGMPYTGQFAEEGYIFGAGGVAPLYRREMLDDVALEGEYFDETYEAYYEDLDLAWRAQIRGWKAYYTPDAVAWHVRGGTAKTERPPFGFMGQSAFAQISGPLKARLLRNRYLTILKDDRPVDFLLNLPFILLYDIKVWTFVLFFSPGSIPLFIRGMRALPAAWRRRKLIHGH